MVVYSAQIMVTGNYGLNFLYSVVNAHEGVTVSGEEIHHRRARLEVWSSPTCQGTEGRHQPDHRPRSLSR